MTTTAARFEERPKAPPRRRLKLSWAGKLGVCVVAFWMIIGIIGPSISPYHEADILDEALFIVPGSDDPYPATDFQPPGKVAWLGTDYLGRDTLSRTLFGARTTIGISLAFGPAGLPRGSHAGHRGGGRGEECWIRCSAGPTTSSCRYRPSLWDSS